MQAKILSVKELREIERAVDEINARAEFLDPAIPNEAEQLYYDDVQLNQYLEILEKSYKQTRIKELGIFIVR